MRRRAFFPCISCAAIVVSSLACNRNPNEVPASLEAGNRQSASHAVQVVAPSREPLPIEVTAPGSFVAYEEATLSAEGTGTVSEVRVKEGSPVSRGMALVLLDKTKAELAIRQAEAALAQAKANFEKAGAELARKEILLSDRTISQGTFDTFKAQYDGAAAAVDGAESTLALARRQLEDTTVLAPFSGVIKEKKVSTGEYVRPADDLLVLIQIDPLKLQFDVPEKHADRMAVGTEVRTSVTALPGEIFTGKVMTIYPALAVQSRTIRVEARVPNPKHRLKPGFYASVRVPLVPVAGALVLPRTAVFRTEGLENVFVLNGDHVRRVVVEVGGDSGDHVEILSGLSPDDRVVVTSVDILKDGDTVTVSS